MSRVEINPSEAYMLAATLKQSLWPFLPYRCSCMGYDDCVRQPQFP